MTELPYNIYTNDKWEDLIIFSIPNLNISTLNLDINSDTLIISWQTTDAITLLKKNEKEKLTVKKEDLELWVIKFSEKIIFDWIISEENSKARFEKWFLIINIKKQNKKWKIMLET